jgi:hypothetical protein
LFYKIKEFLYDAMVKRAQQSKVKQKKRKVKSKDKHEHAITDQVFINHFLITLQSKFLKLQMLLELDPDSLYTFIELRDNSAFFLQDLLFQYGVDLEPNLTKESLVKLLYEFLLENSRAGKGINSI